MSVIVFIIVLSILIVVHEWGHFVAAKSLGVKVEKFSVGFGKKLYSRMHNGTEFLICAIPLGGYVKMAGDERNRCKGKREEFFAHPVSHRALIVAMGPIINFVFAYICLYFIFATGYPALAPKVGEVMDGYPAQAAGLTPGDTIIQIDENKIESFEDMQRVISGSTGAVLNVTIRRGGETIPIAITPQEEMSENVFGQKEKVRLIGIQPNKEITDDDIIFLRYGVIGSFGKSYEHLVMITTLTYKAIYKVVTGAMPAKKAFAGPVLIFDIIKNAAMLGLSHLIYIMAIISASLAIFNLLPIPVLDGGHILLFFVESIRRRPLPLKVEEALTRVGLSLLICLFVFVIYNDAVRIGWVDQIKGLFKNTQSESLTPQEE